MKDFKECLEEGLIKRNKEAPKRVSKSIEIAERFFESAKRNFEIEEYEMAVMGAYNSLFHSSRALLFHKGYVERSHFCLLVAIRTLYKDKSIREFIDTMDKIRISRHQIQYSGEFANKEEAEFVLEFSEEFLKLVKRILL